MNHKNFYPRQDKNVTLNLFNNSNLKPTKKISTFNQNSRKADFNFSDDDYDNGTNNYPNNVFNAGKNFIRSTNSSCLENNRFKFTANVFKTDKNINKNEDSNLFVKNDSSSTLPENLFKVSKSYNKHEKSEMSSEKANYTKINEKTDFKSTSISNFKIYATAEEKYKLLEDLDNFNIPHKSNLGLDRPIVEGTCQDMCPEKERYERELQNNVSIFEKDESGHFDHRKAVKIYERCSIDQKESQPHDLRPTDILKRTMDYLLTNIVDFDEDKATWQTWYRFLWDRTRSIRKDITQQNLSNETVVNIVESITRFHIFCAAWLCENSKDNFDPRMNDDHLKNCLQTLKNMYADMPADSCINEPEFRSYMIILNLDKGEMLDEAQKLTPNVFNSSKLKFAISVYQAVSTNNYVRFFRLLEQSDLVLSCLLHRFILPMRMRAFEVINRAYATNKLSNNQIPLNTISRQLKFENTEEILQFCNAIDQKWIGQSDNLMIVLNYANLDLSRKPELIRKSYQLVDIKRGNRKLSTILNGAPVLLSDDISSCRMISFDNNGVYIGSKQVPPSAKKPSVDVSHETVYYEVISLSSSEEGNEASDNESQVSNSFQNGDEPIVKYQFSSNLFKSYPSQSTTSAGFSPNQNLVFNKSVKNSALFRSGESEFSPTDINLFPSTSNQSSSMLSQTNIFKPQMQETFSVNQPQQFSFLFKEANNPLTSIQFSPPIVVPAKHRFSKEDIEQTAQNVLDQLFDDVIDAQCESQASITLEHEKLDYKNFLNVEADNIQNTLFKDLIKEVIDDLSVVQSRNKNIVCAEVLKELLSKFVDEHMVNVGNYLFKKKIKAQETLSFQKKYYFRRWYRNTQYAIKERKSLTKLPAAPRMADIFIVCQDFRGKVRKISTDWISNNERFCQEHPIVSRFEQLTEQSSRPRAIAQRRSFGIQTNDSCLNKKRINVKEFIKNFIQSRFISILNMQLRVLQDACKIDPTPQVIIADYNRLIDEMASSLKDITAAHLNLLYLKLSIDTWKAECPLDWQAYMNEIFTELRLHSYQKIYYIDVGCQMLQQLNYNPYLSPLSNFHIRLFPWISIIKDAVTNKLDMLDPALSLMKMEIVIKQSFSVTPKLELERISNEISVKTCIDQCQQFQSQFEPTCVSVPKVETDKRSASFTKIWNLTGQLQQIIDECKKNL